MCVEVTGTVSDGLEFLVLPQLGLIVVLLHLGPVLVQQESRVQLFAQGLFHVHSFPGSSVAEWTAYPAVLL